jgi:hypothetical protein
MPAFDKAPAAPIGAILPNAGAPTAPYKDSIAPPMQK